MGEDKRKAIIEAAKRVFTEKGFHGATVDEIAAEAGVAKGTVYLYFKSKAELFVQVALEVFRGLGEKMRGLVEESPDPVGALERAVDIYLDYLADNQDILRMVMGMGPSVRLALNKCHLEEINHGLMACVKDMAELLKEGMRKGIVHEGDPELLALAVMGAVHLPVFSAIRRGGRSPREMKREVAALIKRVLFKGGEG